MTDETGSWPRDTEEQAALVLGALRAVQNLVIYQVLGVDVNSHELGCLLTLIVDEAEKVLPLEKSGADHGRASNDDG